MQYPSKLVEEAVNEVSTEALSEALVNLRTQIKYCKTCFNISDSDKCAICTSHRRDGSIICVVESTQDVLAIENTSQYNGLYHILGGIISPINGIGPEDLNIEALIKRVEEVAQVDEIILALSATMEGDTTAFYVTKRLKEYGKKVTTIARGVPVGGELEYADEITLGRSILSRSTYSI